RLRAERLRGAPGAGTARRRRRPRRPGDGRRVLDDRVPAAARWSRPGLRPPHSSAWEGVTMGDEVMARIVAAVELGRGGARDAARSDLQAVWDAISDDAFHRCVAAHFLADLQDDLRDELRWDERALEAVAAVTD